MSDEIWAICVVLCSVGMGLCVGDILLILHDVVNGFGVDWLHLFASCALFCMAGRECNKLLKEE